MLKRILFISLVLLSVSTARAAVVWDWNGSVLLGAQNVDVGGTLYDVRFLDGSCITNFSDCNEISDFTFGSLVDANSASQSLLAQVFLDSNDVGQMFDALPRLTTGCNRLGVLVCNVLTPYGLSIDGGGADTVLASFAHNASGANANSVGSTAPLITVDLGSTAVYAKWSEINPVPIPAAAWLFGTALIGFVGMSRRRK